MKYRLIPFRVMDAAGNRQDTLTLSLIRSPVYQQDNKPGALICASFFWPLTRLFTVS